MNALIHILQDYFIIGKRDAVEEAVEEWQRKCIAEDEAIRLWVLDLLKQEQQDDSD